MNPAPAPSPIPSRYLYIAAALNHRYVYKGTLVTAWDHRLYRKTLEYFVSLLSRRVRGTTPSTKSLAELAHWYAIIPANDGAAAQARMIVQIPTDMSIPTFSKWASDQWEENRWVKNTFYHEAREGLGPELGFLEAGWGSLP